MQAFLALGYSLALPDDHPALAPDNPLKDFPIEEEIMEKIVKSIFEDDKYSINTKSLTAAEVIF